MLNAKVGILVPEAVPPSDPKPLPSCRPASSMSSACVAVASSLVEAPILTAFALPFAAAEKKKMG